MHGVGHVPRVRAQECAALWDQAHGRFDESGDAVYGCFDAQCTGDPMRALVPIHCVTEFCAQGLALSWFRTPWQQVLYTLVPRTLRPSDEASFMRSWPVCNRIFGHRVNAYTMHVQTRSERLAIQIIFVIACACAWNSTASTWPNPCSRDVSKRKVVARNTSKSVHVRHLLVGGR